jgi:hypothetical protein
MLHIIGIVVIGFLMSALVVTLCFTVGYACGRGIAAGLKDEGLTINFGNCKPLVLRSKIMESEPQEVQK